MIRNVCLAILVCVNLLLLVALVFVAAPPRAAVAQPGGLADNYLVVTGQIQSEHDALYVLEMQERTLHTFTFRRGTRELEYAGARQLERDFRNNRE